MDRLFKIKASATPYIYEIENWWPCNKFQDGTNTLKGLFKAISMFQMLYGCHYLIEKVRFLFMRNRAKAIIQDIATWVGGCWQCLFQFHSRAEAHVELQREILELGWTLCKLLRVRKWTISSSWYLPEFQREVWLISLLSGSIFKHSKPRLQFQRANNVIDDTPTLCIIQPFFADPQKTW